MSTATARTPRTRAALPVGAPRTARLRLVPAPQRLQSRAALVTTSLAVLALGLVVLLVLAVNLQRGAYEMRGLRADETRLIEQRQGLAERIAALQAPAALAQQARELGMVPAPNSAVMRLSDGAVLGEASPAPRAPARVAAPAARPVAKPAAKPAAKPEATATPKATAAATPTADPARPAATPAAAKPVKPVPAAPAGTSAAPTG